jgi:FixJ family two-component response regulator
MPVVDFREAFESFRRILIVDDETNVRLILRMTLETEGYEIFESSSGAQALQTLAEHSFALAILDLRMPGMDGLALLARMREDGIRVPAVMISAHSDVPDAVHAMKLGAVDFLQKPLTPETLRIAVSETLKRHAEKEGRTAEAFSAHIVAAKRCLKERGFATARIHLIKALELNANSAAGFNLAGVLSELLKDHAKAKKCYAFAIELDKNYEPARQNMRRLRDVELFGSCSTPIDLGGE